MKPTVYIETTIPSFLKARTAKDVVIAGKQEVTKQWWAQRRQQYELFVSQLVYDEAVRGDGGAAQERLDALVDIPFLALDEEALELSDAIVRGGVIPAQAHTDAGPYCFGFASWDGLSADLELSAHCKCRNLG